jgi:NAD(P)-dependent dehydrogenase (short-subunit alcohol dehydrogenase family)
MSEGLLDGKVVLVTGAARGIGLAVAQRFAEAGGVVALADVDGDAVQTSADALPGTNIAITVDVSDEAAIDAAVARCATELGGLDVLVANAGLMHVARLVDHDLDSWNRIVSVNLTGTFLCCRAAARQMVSAGRGGRIVVMSSRFGLRGGMESTSYSATKFGVRGIVESAAAELAEHGITVNAVCPGQVDGTMMRALIEGRAAIEGRPAAEVAVDISAQVPAGRMAEMREIADGCLFLASPMASYVNGHSLLIDGGQSVA